MIDRILERAVENPIPYAFSLLLLVIAAGIFVRLIGNPINVLLNHCSSLLSGFAKELRGKAGRAGIIDAAISLFTFILASALLSKPSLLRLFSDESTESRVYGLIVFCLTICVFMISLRMTVEDEKTRNLLKRK